MSSGSEGPEDLAGLARSRRGLAVRVTSIAKERDIDETCGASGDASGGPHAAQNHAKNNFWASGAPIAVTSAMFRALQRAVDKKGIPYGSSNKLPPDRD